MKELQSSYHCGTTIAANERNCLEGPPRNGIQGPVLAPNTVI